MKKNLRILLTNSSLYGHAGTELYIRDLARALQRASHSPIIYSPNLAAPGARIPGMGCTQNSLETAPRCPSLDPHDSENSSGHFVVSNRETSKKPGNIPVGESLQSAGIPVYNNLGQLPDVPDIIHGQHNLETIAALQMFPNVPAVFVCHGLLPWQETVPYLPRILRYVTVSAPSKLRLLRAFPLVSPEHVEIIPNFVDLERFVQSKFETHSADGSGTLLPRRVLIFSNTMTLTNGGEIISAACKELGIPCDLVGRDCGNPTDAPEKLLGNYDLVFARGRSALEALASGCGVVLCDYDGIGDFVTRHNFDHLRLLNFGSRTNTRPLSREAVVQALKSYSRSEATAVSTAHRSSLSVEHAVTRFEDIYAHVVEEWTSLRKNAEDFEWKSRERAAFATYFSWLGRTLHSEEAKLHEQHFALEEGVRENSMLWRELGQYAETQQALLEETRGTEKQVAEQKVHLTELRSRILQLEGQLQAQREAHESQRLEVKRLQILERNYEQVLGSSMFRLMVRPYWRIKEMLS